MEAAMTALPMAAEIFGTAAIFWVLIPVGLADGALLLKLQGDSRQGPGPPRSEVSPSRLLLLRKRTQCRFWW